MTSCSIISNSRDAMFDDHLTNYALKFMQHNDALINMTERALRRIENDTKLYDSYSPRSIRNLSKTYLKLLKCKSRSNLLKSKNQKKIDSNDSMEALKYEEQGGKFDEAASIPNDKRLLESDDDDEAFDDKDQASSTHQLTVEEQERNEKFLASLHSSTGVNDEDDVYFDLLTHSNICPISNGPIKTPVKNSKCGHIFDQNSINMFINEQSRRKRQPLCPISGCTNRKRLEISDFTVIKTEQYPRVKDDSLIDIFPIEQE